MAQRFSGPTAETESVSTDDHLIGDVHAELGPIQFADGLHDPNVEVRTQRETAEHEIVSGHDAYRDQGSEYVVQALGRRPTELTVTGWITTDQLESADDLVSMNRANFVSARWTGIVVPREVDVAYSRNYHDEHGWIFETTFTLLGVSRGELIDDTPSSSISRTRDDGLDDSGFSEPTLDFSDPSDDSYGIALNEGGSGPR